MAQSGIGSSVMVLCTAVIMPLLPASVHHTAVIMAPRFRSSHAVLMLRLPVSVHHTAVIMPLLPLPFITRQ